MLQTNLIWERASINTIKFSNETRSKIRGTEEEKHTEIRLVRMSKARIRYMISIISSTEGIKT